MKVRTTVQVSTGDTWSTTWREAPDAESVEEARDFLKRVSQMTEFELESDKGHVVYFNPAHIVSLYLEITEV